MPHKKRKYSKKASEKISRVMSEFYDKKLKSGGSGKTVTNPSQAKAIALSEASRRGLKVPKKKKK